MHQGFIARAVAGIVTTVALVAGPGVVAAAQADGSASMTAAQHCQQERQDVRRAKVKVAKAKKAKKKAVKAGKKKAVKKATKRLKKAKKNLKAQKAQMSRWCSRAHAEAQQAQHEATTTTKGEDTKSGYDDVATDPSTGSMPPSLQASLLSAVAAAKAQVDQLLAQVPGASPETLDSIDAQLDALDPTSLQMALQELGTQLQTAGGDPAALSALVEGLLGHVADGTTIPTTGGLADLQTTLQDLVAALQGFDPSTGAAGVAGLESAVEALTDQLTTAAPQLATLFGTLADLNGGTVPSDPTALLVLLQGAITGAVGDAGTTTTITDTLGGLLGGLGLGL